jgi:hypothetical protein
VKILVFDTFFTPCHRTRAQSPRNIFKATIDGLFLEHVLVLPSAMRTSGQIAVNRGSLKSCFLVPYREIFKRFSKAGFYLSFGVKKGDRMPGIDMGAP